MHLLEEDYGGLIEITPFITSIMANWVTVVISSLMMSLTLRPLLGSCRAPRLHGRIHSIETSRLYKQMHKGPGISGMTMTDLSYGCS